MYVHLAKAWRARHEFWGLQLPLATCPMKEQSSEPQRKHSHIRISSMTAGSVCSTPANQSSLPDQNTQTALTAVYSTQDWWCHLAKCGGTGASDVHEE